MLASPPRARSSSRLRTALRWLRLPALMVLVGAVTGLLVALLEKPDDLRLWLEQGDLFAPEGPWHSMGFGILYATTMWTALLGARKLAYRYIPLHSLAQFALHVAVLTGVSVVAFSVIYGLDALICSFLDVGSDPDDGPRFVAVAMTAGASALVISVCMYAFDFYRRMRNAEQAVLTSELKALRAQINPHFLFNTLNAIAALARTRPHEAENVTEKLADLFRYTLRASEQPTVTLAEEVEAAQLYASIEQTRFGERLVVLMEVPPRLLDARVPSLMIQPLVENAVKHGASRSAEACAVQVQAKEADGTVTLTVRDTGPGFATTDPAVVFSNGTGLANVRDRLRYLFGEQATLLLLHDGVALRFPYRTTLTRERSAGMPAHVAHTR